MKMRKTNWIAIAALGVAGLLLILLVGGSLFPFAQTGLGTGWGWGCMDGDGWGMRGGGWRPGGMMDGWGFNPLGWIFGLIGLVLPLGFLGLLILGGVWLFRQITQSQKPTTGIDAAHPTQSCPDCGRPVQAAWQLCPYCGRSLTQPEHIASHTA
jgi:hypothetical protein